MKGDLGVVPAILGRERARPSKPAFANQDVGISPCLVGLDLDPKVIRLDVVANLRGLVFRWLEKDLDVLEVAHRGLRIDVEFTKRFDVVAEVFDADRTLGLPGKNVEDAAADGKLATGGDLSRAVVTRGDEPFDRALQRLCFSAPQNENRGIQNSGIRGWLIQRSARRNNEMRAFLALDAVQQRQPLGRNLRIGQNIFDGRQFRFRKKEGCGIPVQQALVKKFLGADAGQKTQRVRRISFANAATRKACAGSVT